MPNVDENRKRGNFAESIAAAWLSRRCLVRPVATGTDIGVDLYCESLIGTSPFQHFWVQVKAISERNIRLSEEAEEAWYDFETRHLRYWARQPVPVYGFLVPVIGWPPAFPSRIYGVRITDKVVREGVPDQDSVRYTASDWFDEDEIDNDLRQFVSKILPVDTAALLLSKGIVARVEWPGEEPEDHFPRDMAIPYLETIEGAIRQTSEICLAELTGATSPTPNTPDTTASRRRFEYILSEYEDSLTALGASAVANSAWLDGNIEKARRLFRIAESLTLDSHVDEATKLTRLQQIQQSLARLG